MYENLKLVVAGLSNDIYLAALDKPRKGFPPTMSGTRRRVITDEAIRAVAEHIMRMPEGVGYEFPGLGKLVWVPEKGVYEHEANHTGNTSDDERDRRTQ